jgi:hypothetical protein
MNMMDNFQDSCQANAKIAVPQSNNVYQQLSAKNEVKVPVSNRIDQLGSQKGQPNHFISLIGVPKAETK